MMTKDAAKEIRGIALEAVRALSRVVSISQDHCSKEELAKIKKGVGLAIGQIQTEILDVVSAAHPELDDLRG
jgi:hypothetical protein